MRPTFPFLLLSLCLVSTFAATYPSLDEVLGMQDLCNALSPPPWNCGSLSNSTVCSNSGVACTSNGVLTGITINGKTNGSIPQTISKLINLDSLDLSDNGLGGSIPVEICSCTKLLTLVLRSNSLTGSVPDCIGNLTNLFTLDLSSTALDGSLPSTIGNLQTLYNLAFDNTLIGGTLPPALFTISTLDTLSFSHSKISGPIPDNFADATNLNVFWGEYTSINGTIPVSICTLQRLSFLSFSHTQLSGAIPDCIGSVSQLSQMFLSSVNFAGTTIPSSIGNLSLLVHLSLDHCGLIGALPPSISNLHLMDQLYLNDNDLSGNIPAGFDAFTIADQIVLVNNPSLSGCLHITSQAVSYSDVSGTNACWYGVGNNNFGQQCNSALINGCNAAGNTPSPTIPPTSVSTPSTISSPSSTPTPDPVATPLPSSPLIPAPCEAGLSCTAFGDILVEAAGPTTLVIANLATGSPNDALINVSSCLDLYGVLTVNVTAVPPDVQRIKVLSYSCAQIISFPIERGWVVVSFDCLNNQSGSSISVNPSPDSDPCQKLLTAVSSSSIDVLVDISNCNGPQSAGPKSCTSLSFEPSKCQMIALCEDKLVVIEGVRYGGALAIVIAVPLAVLTVIFAIIILVSPRIRQRVLPFMDRQRHDPDIASMRSHRGSTSLVDNIYPRKLAQFFDTKHSHSWIKDGKILKRQLLPGTKEWNAMEALFKESLDGDQIVISEAYSIINPFLASNFCVQHSTIYDRLASDPAIFKKDDWKKLDRTEQREWSLDVLKKYGNRFEWNDANDPSPILPVVHGTDFNVAEKIAQNGFSNLSLLDAGFYGRGMYFTRSALYALPYYATKADPGMLVCLIAPGNAFPVVEDITEDNSFMAAPIRSGYQSHYVATQLDGKPCKSIENEGHYYDEFVIDQESQVIPVYLLKLDKLSMIPLTKSFTKGASTPSDVSPLTVNDVLEARKQRIEKEHDQLPSKEESEIRRAKGKEKSTLSTVVADALPVETVDESEISASESGSV